MMLIKLTHFQKMSKSVMTSAADLAVYLVLENMFTCPILHFLHDWNWQLVSSHRSTNKNHHFSNQVTSLIILCHMSKIPSSYRGKSYCLAFYFFGKLTVWRLMVSDKNLWEGFTLIERQGQGLVLPKEEGYDSVAEESVNTRGTLVFSLLADYTSSRDCVVVYMSKCIMINAI